MSDSDASQINRDALRGPARDFIDYCDGELQRRRNSGELFDEESFRKAVDLVLSRLQVLDDGGVL